MKISDSQPPVSDADLETDRADSSQSDEKDEPSSFSRLLVKKQVSNQGGAMQAKDGKQSATEFEAIVATFMQIPKSFDSSMQTAQVESKHAVSLPPELQQVVREISLVVNAAGNHEVHIELNSNVLKGLHIRIGRQEGAVAIQFQSASEQVMNLLSRNLDALSQALVDRGVNVADIRIADSREYSRSKNQKNSSSKFGSREQRGRRGGGRR
jgi:flagellar hook-length control protein FliK